MVLALKTTSSVTVRAIAVALTKKTTVSCLLCVCELEHLCWVMRCSRQALHAEETLGCNNQSDLRLRHTQGLGLLIRSSRDTVKYHCSVRKDPDICSVICCNSGFRKTKNVYQLRLHLVTKGY